MPFGQNIDAEQHDRPGLLAGVGWADAGRVAADQIDLQFGYMFRGNGYRAELAKTGGEPIHNISPLDHFIHISAAFFHLAHTLIAERDGNPIHCDGLHLPQIQTISIDHYCLH